ncbi:hypothetical protein Cva_00457 [Caedimonas varicaedens]|uniref:Uncharacterized protein n=1 Tax=Caedimonas varicaedens TaxID=1629334 RepID=A0A0K8MBH5_9PROT|nr:hypothetical protein Cva_00457 [Caedimonas varicaedens]
MYTKVVEAWMMFPSKIPVSFRHNFKDLNFSEFMLDFYPKRHQLQILANNINKGGHTLVSEAMREGGGQPFFKVFLCVGSAGIVCLLGYRKLKVGTHSS